MNILMINLYMSVQLKITAAKKFLFGKISNWSEEYSALIWAAVAIVLILTTAWAFDRCLRVGAPRFTGNFNARAQTGHWDIQCRR